ncbi:MAG: hypothetical protein FJ267_06860, partial [Planctomycetes bacterium]|nr:hypothetical protein [Planctomycetota bacterium]
MLESKVATGSHRPFLSDPQPKGPMTTQGIPSGGSGSPQVYDLFADLFSTPTSGTVPVNSMGPVSGSNASDQSPPIASPETVRRNSAASIPPAQAPKCPSTLAEAGLLLSQLSDLAL